MERDLFQLSNNVDEAPGEVAESLGRFWLSIELDRRYASLSAVRFMNDWTLEAMKQAVQAMEAGASLELKSESGAPRMPLFDAGQAG